MSRYRRAHVPGATYFFTVNLRNRRSDLRATASGCCEKPFALQETTTLHPVAWAAYLTNVFTWTPPDGGTGFTLCWKLC
jgi:putative transposase